MSSILYLHGSFLPSLLLILFLGLFGTGGQEEFQVLQPKDPIYVAEGGTVRLNCTLLGIAPSGPVKWFKGKGRQREEIYSFKGSTHPRIKATASYSNTDFSIIISHIIPEDTGIYYCVKFVKRIIYDEKIKSGEGTMLSVSGKGISGQFFIIFLLTVKVLLLFSISLLYVLQKQKIRGLPTPSSPLKASGPRAVPPSIDTPASTLQGRREVTTKI